jgi:hypothetical protein
MSRRKKGCGEHPSLRPIIHIDEEPRSRYWVSSYVHRYGAPDELGFYGRVEHFDALCKKAEVRMALGDRGAVCLTDERPPAMPKPRGRSKRGQAVTGRNWLLPG